MWNLVLLAPALASILNSIPCFAYASHSESQPSKRATVLGSSNMTMESAHFFPGHNSKRVKIRYGPFTVPPASINNGMKDWLEPVVQMPCTDCLITWMQAGLEYPNGTVANADTNLWLHHTVFSNTERNSTVCPDSGPGDSFFASGNERTPIDICVNGTDQVGYYLGPEDNLGFLVELMNMEEYTQEGVVTMTWEYIPSVPTAFDKVTAIWLDIGGCNGSSDQPAKNDAAFNYTSPPWISDFNGRITFVAGHLHDGGTQLTVKKNNTVECECKAAYGQNSAYIDGGMATSTSTMPGMSMTIKPREATSMSMDMSSMSKSSTSKTSMALSTSTSMPGMDMGNDTIHISSISTCSNDGTVNVGDEWTITAFYNATEHALMTDTDGSLAPIMGISLLYIAQMNMTTIPADAASSSSGASSTSTSTSAGTRGYEVILADVLQCGGLMALLMAIL